MSMKDRYNTDGFTEDMYEPGSDNKVLKNKLGINNIQEMNEAELNSLLKAMHTVVGLYDETHRFTASDICKIHRIWLGDIYDWAGQYRSVNISKGDFTFAMAMHVPDLMQDFEPGLLKELTPCQFSKPNEIIHAIAVVHTELVLIHPFREGNGRLARILSTLMGLQAGVPPLEFACLDGKLKERYFHAVQEGMKCNYRPMEEIFKTVLESSF